MPTGYTARLYEGKGISFPEFAMQCARAFGALIEMRDMGLDATIPDEFTPSNYHVEQLEKARQRLDEVETWDDEEAERQARASYQRDYDEYVSSLIERNERHFRYDQMLRQVRDWNPPTPDHENLKKFMIEQLTSSIEHDCTGWPLQPPIQLSGADYKAQEIAHAERDIDYHTQHHEEEVERAESRTDWIRALRESLAEESTVEA